MIIGLWGNQDDSHQAWLNSLRNQLPAGVQFAAGPGTVQTDHLLNTANEPAAVLRAVAELSKGEASGLLKWGTNLPDHWLERLLRYSELEVEAVAVTPLSQRLLTLPDQLTGVPSEQVDAAVFTLSQRCFFAVRDLEPDCCLWTGIIPVPETDDWSAFMREINGAAKTILACDHLYVQSQSSCSKTEHSAAASLIEGKLSANAAQLPRTIPQPGLSDRPVVLHICHSWGGGAAQWTSDIASGLDDREHLFLIATGDELGLDCGQSLSLRMGHPTHGVELAYWQLARSIASINLGNAEYQHILDELIRRYCVDQVIVSSLIGHSLDVLATGLPTLVVFHDYFPSWPVLSSRLEDQQTFDTEALTAAMLSERQSRFGDLSAQTWLEIRRTYIDLLKTRQIVCAAPSQSVIDNLQRIDADFQQLTIHKIGHGFDGWPDPTYQYRPNPEGQRLKLLIPGRISDTKGKPLLKQALPELSKIADIYLVGAGLDGHDFFGCSGVHVLINYQREQLPELLQTLQPDAGLLLSRASETFTYTLSELHTLGIPVIATRSGSLNERIQHQQNGWLFDPDPQALVSLVRHIDRQQLLNCSQAIQAQTHRTVAMMSDDYRQYFPAADRAGVRYPVQLVHNEIMLKSELAGLKTEYSDKLKQLRSKIKLQQKDLNKRASWGFDLNRQLEKRTEWAKSLESDLKERLEQLDNLRQQFDERTEWALALEDEKESLKEHLAQQFAEMEAQRIRLEGDISELAAKLDQIINSRSWRLTKPFRFAARQARAVLISVRSRLSRTKTLAGRARHSLKNRGLMGTLKRGVQAFKPSKPPHTVATVEPLQDRPDPVTLNAMENPAISVIIPVYNQLSHTAGCLNSILHAENKASFEVIVVDDASQDDTADYLSRCEGLTALSNPHNLGFIGTCNRGAEAASGEYLVFLNNDTAVADGWLDALLDTFEQRPDAGLVGSKLIYPDGRMQEAGGIIFADGSGWNYGRFEDPDHPAYNFVREVDYCSGAAIMIRAALFQQFGGFDSHYAPAYYEDTDLAFKVRQAGLKVYFQPKSVVTHYEGITSGTDTSSGTKRYQVVNQEKFLTRWDEVLQTHPENAQNIHQARQHRNLGRALIIDACTPMPDQDSGSVRMTNLMSLLQQLGYSVSFLADNRGYDGAYSEALQQQGIEVLFNPYASSLKDIFTDVCPNPDLIVLSRHYVAERYIEAARNYAPNAKLLFDTVDLHFLREQRLAELEQDEKLAATAAATRDNELKVARACDVTLVVSPFEKEVLAEQASDITVKLVSNIHEIFGCRNPYQERKDLMFIGGFQHPPNIDAVQFFTQQVFPLVRQALPDVQFHVIGSKMPPEIENIEQDGVVIHGFVQDIEPFLDGCRIALAPLRYGAGVKGKVNMSMSYGQPVVATSPAVEGMHAVSGQDVMVADQPSDFADAVIRLYQDQQLWETLSENGLKNVEAHFSMGAARNALADILGELQLPYKEAD